MRRIVLLLALALVFAGCQEMEAPKVWRAGSGDPVPIAVEKLVGEMRPGDFGWTTPSALKVADNVARLSPGHKVYAERKDIATMRVERVQKGFRVDVTGVDKVYTRQKDPKGLPVVEMIYR